MTPNVVSLVQGALGPEVLAAAGERLGEDPNAVGRAVGAGAPAVLWRLIERGRAPGGADALLGAMRRTGAARALADPLGRLQPDAQADAELLGDDVSGRLAAFAQIGEGSAGALLAMLTPLGLGALARIAPTPLNVDTLARTLREQENNVERAFPPGFDLRGAEPPVPASQLDVQPAASTGGTAGGAAMEGLAPASREEGVRSSAPRPAPIAQPPAARDAEPAPAGGLPKWLLPLLAALILLAVILFVVRGMAAQETAPSAPSGVSTEASGVPADEPRTP